MNEKFLKYYEDKRYTAIIDVAMFFLLILGFHFLYLFWVKLHFWPIADTIKSFFEWASSILFNQSQWVLEHVFNVDIVTYKHSLGLLNNEGTYSFVAVAPECTSLKQWMHWLFLMLIFPGPWRHKAWYIPLGLIIIEFVNVVRVTGILMMLKYWPDNFALFHNYIFKVFFYFMIFVMWVIWVEFFVHGKKSNSYKNGQQDNLHT